MKNLILMGEPHHGNIGDNAIAIAERRLVEELFSDYNFYALGEKNLDVCAERAKKFIKDDDIILLHGGGNIGDTYERPEKGRRKIIELFHNNKIILFPQTVYFSDTEEGRKQLEISKEIYNNHPNLVLMAREKESFEFMKKHFTNAKVYFTPDIVMTLNEQKNLKREGALLLFRTDREKVFDDESIKMVEDKVSKLYKSFKYSDMSLGSGLVNIAGKYRDTILENKFNQFSTSEIAITDRLHGMIFAAVTGTPCVAFGNFNHKIEKSFEWLKDLGYIVFCNDFSKFDEALQKARAASNRVYDNTFARDIILKILKEEIK